jgi:hypothetical protein
VTALRIQSLRLGPIAWAYVAVVASLATAGFVSGSPWPILLAAALALPMSLIALPGYYLLYGFLALIPGANPSSSSGSGTVAADGSTVTSVSSGSSAPWFDATTHAVGILALTGAAILNVLIVRAWSGRAAKRPA